jgi:hypothetical protein
MPLGEDGYQPPLTKAGYIDADALTPCGGFVRFAQHWWGRKPKEQAQEVARLQLHMIRRYLEARPGLLRGHPLESRAKDLQRAVQFMAQGNHACQIDESGGETP